MLEDILEPSETIIFRQHFETEVENEKYNELALTNKRVIVYKRKGLVFKKDSLSSVPLSNINNVKFLEKGVIRKKGVLELDILKGKFPPLVGKPSEIKYIYQQILNHIK